jgi:parallel beta-helix repeat protein
MTTNVPLPDAPRTYSRSGARRRSTFGLPRPRALRASRPLRGAAAVLVALLTISAVIAVNPANPTTAAGACPVDRVPAAGFTDVAPGHAHEGSVDCLVWWGITAGQTAELYAPDAAMTRAQMATMLDNLLAETDEHPGAVPPAEFDDVAPDAVHGGGISVLAHLGVVSGNEGRYLPDAPVTRDQMATMLVNLLETVFGLELRPGTPFADTVGNVHAASITKLVGTGITKGLTADTYGPSAVVSRAQMATFLTQSAGILTDAGLASPPEATAQAPAAPAPAPAPAPAEAAPAAAEPAPVPEPAPAAEPAAVEHAAETAPAGGAAVAPAAATVTAAAAPTAAYHQGRVFYVATTGSNTNPGTIERPFATVDHAHGAARPGDTIYVRGGVYKSRDKVVLRNSGTPGAPIRVFAYGDETPVLDGSDRRRVNDYEFVLVLMQASHNHIRGLELRNGPRNVPGGTGGLALNASHHNVIEQLDVHRNGQAGIVLLQSSNNRLVNNDSHDNRDETKGDADGFAISPGSHNNVLTGNRAWRNSDDGYDLWEAPPVQLLGNWAFENGFDDSMRPLGDGNGFKLGRGNGGHLVRQNLAWRNRLHGFDENSGGPMRLENNTAWGNIAEDFWFTNATTFRNNVAVGAVRVTGGSQTGNSWTLPLSVGPEDFESLDDRVARGPRRANGDLPVSGFLRPTAQSELRNAGVDIGMLFAGSAPDLGAYERSG